jgi:hypothetical protein
VDFGELSDKAIKVLTYLSKIVSNFLYILMSNYWSIYLWLNIIWLTLTKSNTWMILMHK